MALSIVAPPVTQPITLSEAKAFLRVEDAYQDSVITHLIKAAVSYIENIANIALITQDWDYWLDGWPVYSSRAYRDLWWDGMREGPFSLIHPTALEIPIPKRPLQSILSIDTFDRDGNSSTWDASNYFVDTYSVPGKIVPSQLGILPQTNLRSSKAIRIRFRAGYGISGANAPTDVVQALYMLISHWFENREAVLTGSISKEIEHSLSAILSRYREVRV